MGKTTNLNWLAGFQPSTVLMGYPIFFSAQQIAPAGAGHFFRQKCAWTCQ